MTSYLKSFANRKTIGQIVRVGLIGSLNSVVYFIVLNLALGSFGSIGAITIAFGVATGMSYLLNRRWSFRIDTGPIGSAKESSSFFAVNFASYVVTLIVVQGADLFWGPLGRLDINLANLVAAGVIMLPNFAMYRDVVFRSSLEESAGAEALP